MKRSNVIAISSHGKKKNKRQHALIRSDESEEDDLTTGELEKNSGDVRQLEIMVTQNLPSTSSNNDNCIVLQTMTKTQQKYTEFFEVCSVDKEKHGKCLLCLKSGIDRRIKMKDSNTSGLQRHLRNVHRGDSSVKNLVDISTPSRKKDSRTFEQRVVEWMAIKYLPFSFFDDDATQDFFAFLNGNFAYPKRTSLREKVMNHFVIMRAAVFKTLKGVDSKFSLTVDGWTSIANRSYYGITMHYIDNNWNLQSLPLDFIPSNGAHTGKDMANLVLDVLEEFEIKTKIQGITLDNAAANTSFIAELSDLLCAEGIEFNASDSHFRCFAHILNLGVQDTLNALNPARSDFELSTDIGSSDEETVLSVWEQSKESNVIHKLRKLLLKLKRSEQWTNKLHAYCDAVNEKKITITIDVSTRWNSTYTMLRTALSLKSALNALVHSYGELRDMIINPEEWEMIETVCAYLKPFDHLSTVLGGQTYITLPLVIVGFNMLLDKIETVAHQLDEKPTRSPVDEKFIEAFQAGRDKMIKHYKKTNWIYGVVLILDPRHKVETFQLTSWGRNIEQPSIAKFQKIFQEQYCANSTVDKILSQGKSLSDQGSQGSFDLYELYEASTQIFHTEECSEPQREFERYCKLKRASRNENILEWWRNNSQSFPNLARMARDFLSIPATSVPAERLFSKAGLILRKHRNRMTNESARSLLCMNGWLTCSLKSVIQQNLNPSE